MEGNYANEVREIFIESRGKKLKCKSGQHLKSGFDPYNFFLSFFSFIEPHPKYQLGDFPY